MLHVRSVILSTNIIGKCEFTRMILFRFLLAVMGAYRQMDLEQQNFDYASELLCQGREYFNHAFISFRKRTPS